MAAIPTKYRGLQMRSRIEARWAAMFDRVGWPWEYEPPGDVRSWGECSWQMCRACNALSIVHAIEGYFCRKCGAWDGDHYLGGASADAIAAHWTAAANKTMWKAPA